jgi:hypothetical protein
VAGADITELARLDVLKAKVLSIAAFPSSTS